METGPPSQLDEPKRPRQQALGALGGSVAMDGDEGPPSTSGSGPELPTDCAEVYDLRAHHSPLPRGKCVYIQSGDPGDFDGEGGRGDALLGAGQRVVKSSTPRRPARAGYLIGLAGTEMEKRTSELQFVLVVGAGGLVSCAASGVRAHVAGACMHMRAQPHGAQHAHGTHTRTCTAGHAHTRACGAHGRAQMPERRACPDRSEPNVNKHDETFSEQVMHVAGRLARFLCPHAFIVRCARPNTAAAATAAAAVARHPACHTQPAVQVLDAPCTHARTQGALEYQERHPPQIHLLRAGALWAAGGQPATWCVHTARLRAKRLLAPCSQG